MYSTQNSEKKHLTKMEFCNLCGISESTGYKMMKNRKVKFVKCRDGLLHYYKIPIEEAYRYLRKKELKNKLPGDYQERIKKYYEDKLKSYDDLITSKDIRTITGYGKEAIRNWINSEKILGVVCRGKFRIAKDDLLDFLISPYYFSITRKSKTHIEDFKKIGGLING